jgi:hypothetical protein
MSAPTPAATTMVAVRCPASNPVIAGRIARSCIPAAIAQAQSAPGVMTKRIETPQNATNIPIDKAAAPAAQTCFRWVGRILLYARNMLPKPCYQGRF